MTDSLIKNLRDLAAFAHADLSVADEAADEIERLRRIIYNLLDDGDETDRAEARAVLGKEKPFEDRWDNA